MAQFTVLQMVQNILSSLDSDEVNSIGDTIESRQIAQILQNKYYDMTARGALPEHTQLVQLQPSTDPFKPNLMIIPQEITKVEWIKYFDSNPADGANLQGGQFGSFSHDLNLDLSGQQTWTTTSTTSNTPGIGTKTFTVVSYNNPAIQVGQGVAISSLITGSTMNGTIQGYGGYTLTVNVFSFTGSGTATDWTITGPSSLTVAPGYLYVTILPIDQFVDYVNRFNPSEANTRTLDFNEGAFNFTLYYKNDHRPQYCTVLENTYAIFDSFDATQDSTLQGSKTMCLGQIVPDFVLSDNFIPDLDAQHYPLLINEAKLWAWMELKQMPHPKAEQETKRQWSTVQKNKSYVNQPSYFDQLANFGRVPRTGGYASGGYGAYKWMRQSSP